MHREYTSIFLVGCFTTLPVALAPIPFWLLMFAATGEAWCAVSQLVAWVGGWLALGAVLGAILLAIIAYKESL